jgi:uncharacterized protein YcbK (DUF882 family)
MDHETNVVLEDLWEWAGGTWVRINSGCRCPSYNVEIGGSEDSWHMKARAADVVVGGKTPKEVYEYLDERYPNKYGIGSYETFTHIDTRVKKARW